MLKNNDFRLYLFNTLEDSKEGLYPLLEMVFSV